MTGEGVAASGTGVAGADSASQGQLARQIKSLSRDALKARIADGTERTIVAGGPSIQVHWPRDRADRRRGQRMRRQRQAPSERAIWRRKRISSMEAEVRAALTTAGYSQVHDLEYDDGLWKAKAHSATGERMEIYADPTDGGVVSAQRD